MFDNKAAPLRVSDAAELGIPVLQVVSARREAFPPLPPRKPEDGLYDRLDTLIEEVVGLRGDLERRSFGGRLRRFWAWLRGVVGR